MKEINNERKFFFEGEIFTRFKLDGSETIWMLKDKILDRKTSERLEALFCEKGN